MLLNSLSCVVLIAWAVWSALSSKVNDGIVGKTIFGLIALSAMAVLLGGDKSAEIALRASVAAYGVRLCFLRYYWSFILRKFLPRHAQHNWRRADDIY